MSEPPPSAIVRARTILAASDGRRQIAPLSGSDPAFDLAAAYRVAAQVRRLREARGARVVGRKIGFTNTAVWADYAVRAPIWGYVYDTTLHHHAAGAPALPLAPFLAPRIEPEIVFGLSRAPRPGMDPRALIGCVDWAAQGFEIVQSLFPDWRFSAADTVAAFGLHAALVVGAPVRLAAEDAGMWCAALSDFGITLLRDGEPAGRGLAEHVLGGGPLMALAHLVEMLAQDPDSPPLDAGDIVTTGTLTPALPVAAGQTWRTRLTALPLPGLALTFA